MGLGRYIARRALYTAILLVVIVVFNFVLFQILPFTTSCPGLSYNQCVQLLYVPAQPSARAANVTAVIAYERAQVIKAYGFNQPMLTRFGLYIINMFTGQFGFNIGGLIGGPVSQTIDSRIPYTILLLGSSTVASFLVGIGIGVVAAAKRGRVVDVSSLAALLFINAMPVFFLGGVLVVAQIVIVGQAYVNVGTLLLTKTGIATVVPLLQGLWLPFLTLTLAGLGSVFLTMRATMIDAIGEDYVLMARAKGLPERTVLYTHAFRNAVLPIATAFAIAIGFLLGGAIITETVFGWPGLGIAIYNGVVSNDFPLEQAIFFIISVMVLIAIFIVDIAYGFMDPRVRTE